MNLRTPRQICSGWILVSLITSQLWTSPYALAESLSMAPENPPDKLHERITRKEVKTPLIITRSVIDLPRKVNEAEFRITSKDGQFIDMKETPRQKITRRQGNILQLDVRKYLPPNTLQEFPLQEEKDFLKSTSLVDSGSTSVSIKAHEVAKGEIYAYEAGKTLQKWVYDHIKTEKHHDQPKSASETLLSRSGSSLEKALLHVALCRSMGIPARIAAGVEFDELGQTGVGSFKYHVWSEAFIGEWVPFDPSHQDFLVDATHIKFTDSAFDSMDDSDLLYKKVKEQMDRMTIEVLRAEAAGSTEISLTGRAVENRELQPPAIDILQIDIQKRTEQDVHQFTITPSDNILSLKSNESLFTYGAEQLLEGNIDEARQAFLRLSDQRLSTAVEHYSLGEKLVGLGLFSLAQREFDKATRLDSSLLANVNNWKHEHFPLRLIAKDLENTYLLALTKASTGEDVTTTKDLLKEVIQKAPNFSPAHLQLGQLYFSNHELEQAEKAYNQFLQIRSGDPRGNLGIGLLKMEQAQYAQAVERFRRSEKQASLYHSPQAQRMKRDIDNWKKMAEGRLLLTENPKSETRQATGWLMVGQAFREQGRIENAKTAYQKAIALRSNDSLARLALLDLYLAQGEKLKAEKLFTELKTTSFPTAKSQSVFHRLNGYNHMRNRFYPEAEKALKQALYMDGTDPESYLVLSQVYMRQGEKQVASDLLRQGIQQVPDIFGKNKLRHQLAKILINMNPDEAERQFNALLLDDPSNPENYYGLGKIALSANDFTTARSRFFQSYLLDPDDPENLTALATLYNKENMIEEAMTYYQRALRISPGHYEAATRLGKLIESHNLRIKRPKRIIELSTDEYDYLADFLSKNLQTQLKLKAIYDKLADRLKGYSNTDIQSIMSRHQSVPLLKKHYAVLQSALKRLESITPPGRFNQYHYQAANVLQSNLEFARFLQENVPQMFLGKAKQNFQLKLIQNGLASEKASIPFQKETQAIFSHTTDIQVAAILLEAGYDMNPSNPNRFNPQEPSLKKLLGILVESEPKGNKHSSSTRTPKAPSKPPPPRAFKK